MRNHTAVTIIAGHDTDEKREASTLDWLKKHNATIEAFGSLQIVTMRARKPSETQYKHQWHITFDAADEEREESCLIIDLEPDPHDTRIYVEFDGSYECDCRGRGCVTCNGELAAIARGENPYAHHTTKQGK